MGILDSLKKLNIFSRIKELEKREKERDEALTIIVSSLEVIDHYLAERIKRIDDEDKKIDTIMARVISLDMEETLDVN